MRNKKGLAQIPLMIGLLIMAVVVPVATKLVQENQDNRNQAAMPSCGSSGTISQCGFNGGCSTGYRCLPNGCSYDPACGGFVPTNTPRPNATNTPTLGPACNSKNVNKCGPAAGCKPNIQCINSGGKYQCYGFCTTDPTNTPRPTTDPSLCGASTVNKCGNPGGCSIGYKCEFVNGDYWCRKNTSCPQVPTNTPRPTSTPTPYCSASGSTCTIDLQCCTKICSSGKCSTTRAPTKAPTNSVCKNAGQLCNTTTQLCCAGQGTRCESAICCVINGNTAPNKDYCCSRYITGGKCAQNPSVSPTKVPTTTPTVRKDCCYRVYGSENCSANSGSYSACNSLTSKGCVWQCTVPTVTPTIKCSKTGGACNFQGDCCSGNVCWNGHCYVSNGPSQTPTKKPTGTNPTGIYPTGVNPTKIPIPTSGGCSGSKPADKCESKTLYIDAQCVNNQWDWNEQLCNNTGRTETCGGKNYCCPTVGGSWTTDMSKCSLTKCTECPTTFSCYQSEGEYRWFATGMQMIDFTKVADSLCSQIVKPSFKGKSKGDANCDGTIDNWDFDLWYKEFFEGDKGTVNKKTWNADFTGTNGVCDGLVDTYDYSLWQKYFNQFNITL